jgi:hypothetical protein
LSLDRYYYYIVFCWYVGSPDPASLGSRKEPCGRL